MNKIAGLSNVEYRRMTGLSASDLKELYKNPFKFSKHLKKEASEAQNLGSAIHSLILEPENFERDFVILDCDRRTKEGKKATEEALNSNKIILKAEQYVKTLNVANDFKATEFYKEFFVKDFGEAEQSYFAEYNNHAVKCRPDFYNYTKNWIFDLKTTNLENGASADEFQKSVANHQYYLQSYLYRKITGADKFIFIVLETNEPYCVGVYELNYLFDELAEKEIEIALNNFDNLENINKFYQNCEIKKLEIQMLEPPTWLFYKK